MLDAESQAPIPVLVVGDRAGRIAVDLGTGLLETGAGAQYSCASFEHAASAADASQGAPHLILVGVGERAAEILSDPVWQAWSRPGAAIARISARSGAPGPSRSTSLVCIAQPRPRSLAAITAWAARVLA